MGALLQQALLSEAGGHCEWVLLAVLLTLNFMVL
jgi:hypothetical protein